MSAAEMLASRLQRVVAEAERDWRAGTSEADVSLGGGLASIFRDSGWSRSGVDFDHSTSWSRAGAA